MMPRVFVGRERELAALEASLARATAGRGGLTRIVGEPGVGKSRLADALVERAFASGLTVGWARCWEGSPPFGVVCEAIRSAHAAHGSLVEALEPHRSALAPLFPELASAGSSEPRAL